MVPLPVRGLSFFLSFSKFIFFVVPPVFFLAGDDPPDPLLEDKLKASNIKAKKVNGNGTIPKSILRTGIPIAKKSNAHKNSSTRTPKTLSKSDSPDCGANNKGSASGKGKKNGKGQKVSFNGKKAATRTNLPKWI